MERSGSRWVPGPSDCTSDCRVVIDAEEPPTGQGWGLFFSTVAPSRPIAALADSAPRADGLAELGLGPRWDPALLRDEHSHASCHHWLGRGPNSRGGTVGHDR